MSFTPNEHHSIVVPARSTASIIGLTNSIRTTLGVGPLDQIDIGHVLEVDLPQLLDAYSFEVRDFEEMPNAEGFTLFDQSTIILRQDVYEALQRGENRARFTTAHEIGHLLLRHNMIHGLARAPKPKDTPVYKWSEWQANTFAGTLLLPLSLARHAGNPASASLLAGMSDIAAKVTMSHYEKGGLL